MDAQLKADWVAALRSGNYRRGMGKLYIEQDSSHCCLGVLCDIVDPSGWDGDQWGTGEDVSAYLLPAPLAFRAFGGSEEDEDLDQSGTLPFTVRPTGNDSKGSDWIPNLSGLNDSGQFTFDQLADIIEWAF